RVQNVFEPRTPGVCPDFLECRNNPRSHHMPVVMGSGPEQVYRRRFSRCRVEIHDLARPVCWNVIQNVQCEVSVGVDDPHTSTILDVLQNEIAKQCGFPSTRLPNHIGMLAPRGDINTKRDVAAPFMSVPYENVIVRFHPSNPLVRECCDSPRSPSCTRNDDIRV